jgi:hypothetical protein
LNGKVKIDFASSSTVRDFPMPELWTIGRMLLYIEFLERVVFILVRASSKIKAEEPRYFSFQALAVTIWRRYDLVPPVYARTYPHLEHR